MDGRKKGGRREKIKEGGFGKKDGGLDGDKEIRGKMKKLKREGRKKIIPLKLLNN